MRVIRTSKVRLADTTAKKREALNSLLCRYAQAVNQFVDLFWDEVPKKSELLKDVYNQVDLDLSAVLRQTAAREAIDLVLAVKNKKKGKKSRPRHAGRSMRLSSHNVEFQKSHNTFDRWLHLSSLGQKLILDLPIKLHKQFHRLARQGKLLNSFVVTKNYVQFCFEIETGPKKSEGHQVGIDTGVNCLASLSDGRQFGKNIKQLIRKIDRKKHGSKAQKRARRHLKQRMDEVAKQIIRQPELQLVAVENLRSLNFKSKVKRRLTKTMRRTIGSWNYRYWLTRIQQRCEDNRVVFRSVNPWKTSQRCSACGHTDRDNRSGQEFLCRGCGHTCDADINAAKNILDRCLSGAYGPGLMKPDSGEILSQERYLSEFTLKQGS